MVTMVTIGGDLQPGCLADRLLTGLTSVQGLASRGYKDGLQPETLADGNCLVKQYQPVCPSDTLLACALASVGQFLRLWFFKEGFSV